MYAHPRVLVGHFAQSLVFCVVFVLLLFAIVFFDLPLQITSFYTMFHFSMQIQY